MRDRPGFSLGASMSLSTAQLAALKTNIAANSATVLINGSPTAINAVPASPNYLA